MSLLNPILQNLDNKQKFLPMGRLAIAFINVVAFGINYSISSHF